MSRDSAAGDDPMRGRAVDDLDAERHQEIARCLFRESNDALFLFDPEDHRVLDVNPAALRLTGFTKEQAKASQLSDLFSGDAPGLLDGLVDAYRRTGFYHSREGFSLARLVGGPIPVNVSVSRIHTRPDPLGLVTARDVTDRKRGEQAVRESEARYRGLVEAAKVVFWTLTAQGRVRSLNPRFAALTGWTTQAWIGRPMTDLIVREDRESASTWLASAVRGDLPPPIELRVATRSGSTVTFEFLPTASVPEGSTFEVSGIARDVTESRKMAEALKLAEALDRARGEAEAADRAKTTFLAQFSHEIRTPLTAILGFTEVLLGDPDVAKLPADRFEDLQIIERNGAHLLSIIDDILDLSEVEAGKLRISPSSCSPRRVAEDVAASLAVRADAKGLRMTVDADPAVPTAIITDPVRFHQIVMNLVVNAIKYTERGSVSVTLSKIEEAGVAALAVEIADTGVGIGRDALAHLFEPFYRVPSTPSNGSGLGLAISRRLAQALGGRITVASEPGRGSSFRLILPLAPNTPKDGVVPLFSPPSAAAVFELLNAHVLLAEDNSAIQRVTTLHLERAGATVTLARNGQEAIDSARSANDDGHPFDVILLDMHMPILDGYEAVRQLRANGYDGTIVALTAYAMAEDREECLRIGCDEHLSKPIDWGRLSAVIAAALGGKIRVSA